MVFLLPSLSMRLLFAALPAAVPTRALRQQKLAWANCSPALGVSCGVCAMVRDTATSEMLSSHLIPGSPDSLREVLLAGKGSMQSVVAAPAKRIIW